MTMHAVQRQPRPTAQMSRKQPVSAIAASTTVDDDLDGIGSLDELDVLLPSSNGTSGDLYVSTVSFSSQFPEIRPEMVGCSNCKPLVNAAQGVGAHSVANWIAALKFTMQQQTIAMLHPPDKGDDNGTVFVECTSCQLRHHATWQHGGETTRWLMGHPPDGPVFQGQSTFQPDSLLAEDRSKHYRGHNLALLNGQRERGGWHATPLSLRT